MKVLALDTSTPTASLALVEGSSGQALVRAESRPAGGRTHSVTLLPEIHRLLEAVGWKVRELDLMAVGLGPGSFTGLRIGLAAAKGLAWAAGKPLVGVPTLDALAFGRSSGDLLLCPVVDARKNQVYAAFYRPGPGNLPERLSEYRAFTVGGLAEAVSGPTLFFGPGMAAIESPLKERLGPLFRRGEPEADPVSAAALARLALERPLGSDETDPVRVSPLYVRPPDIRRPPPLRKDFLA